MINQNLNEKQTKMSQVNDNNAEACTSSTASTSSRSSSAKYSKNTNAYNSIQGVKIFTHQKGTSSNAKVFHTTQNINRTRNTSESTNDLEDVNANLSKIAKNQNVNDKNNNQQKEQSALNDSQSIKICMNKSIFPPDCLKFSKKKDQLEKKLEKELNKTEPQLPMVKFDSEGDFFKEPFNFKLNDNDSDKADQESHIIHLTKTCIIDTKKVKKFLKKSFKFAFSQIGLVGLVVGYVIMGALLFMKIESEYEKENQDKIERNREEFFTNVKLSAETMFNEYLRHNFHKKYNEYRNEEMRMKDGVEEIKKSSWFIELDKEIFSKELNDHLRTLLMENEKIEDKEKTAMLVREDVWNYPNALLYSATVITTIGYGNITPKSNAGKILTIFYAMIGIPLMFMCLTNTGDLLAEVFITTYSKCIRFFYRRLFRHKLKMPYSSAKFQENKQEILNEFELEYDNPNDRHVPIVATLGVVTAYIFAGAGIFAFTENWSVLDGAYFCFITFTTIGFGDFVPGKNTLTTEKQGMAALCALYLLMGMIIMAMCFKLMQDEVVSKARLFGRRLGILDT